MEHTKPTFTGSIPKSYARDLVPIVFEPFAQNLMHRVPAVAQDSVLELACGTGVLSKLLRAKLPLSARLVVTDFSQAMLDEAREGATSWENTDWQLADGSNLPFPDAAFDVVCCQFGLMFFPDKQTAMAHALRILKPGGLCLFNVWATLPEIPVFYAVELALQEAFPDEPRPILATPASMGDMEQLKTLLTDAGFADINVEKVTIEVTGFPPSQVASGFVYGTPLSKFIKDNGKSPEEMVQRIQQKVEERLGNPIAAQMTAIVCEAKAPPAL